MIELSRHIESLMLKHDCVIVPGLGGFVTQYVPARRIDDEQLFLPPCRSVGFNPQLSLNDGLLVQSYMQAYDTNYPETVKLIDDAVQQLKNKLREDGEYELSGIGRLTLGIGGKYDFTPYESGVLSPELYGLDAVTVPTIAQKRKEEEKEDSVISKAKKKVNVKRTEKNYTISINRELVNYVAAAVVAIFFYCLWVTPLNNTPQSEQQTASVVYEQLFNQSSSTHKIVASKPCNAQPIAAPTKATSDSANVAPTAQASASQSQAETTQETTTQQETATVSKGKYTLVLASAIEETNANTYASKLKKEGMSEAAPYKKGKMVRVVYGSYPTESAAQEALHKMHKHQAFADAWVMKVE